jgi:predicted RNA-binding Zn-ribbon protein involved in translation (DUF1610 family)
METVYCPKCGAPMTILPNDSSSHFTKVYGCLECGHLKKINAGYQCESCPTVNDYLADLAQKGELPMDFYAVPGVYSYH